MASDDLVSGAVKEIISMINIIDDPGRFSRQDLARANGRLNEILKNDMVNNVQLYLETAMSLIRNQTPVNDNVQEISVYYGYQIFESLVRHQWYSMPETWKMQLKNHAIERLTGPADQFKVSSLILNTCSRFITEIFIREWPNHWPEFLPALLTTHGTIPSLISLYTLLNISDYLQKLLMPNNGVRRREITKSLGAEKDAIIQYLLCALTILDSPNPPPIVGIKLLEVLDSLLEWYPLDEQLLKKLSLIATGSSDFRIKMLTYRIIQTLIQRQPARTDNTDLIVDILLDPNETKFPHYLITTELPSKLFNMIKTEASEQLWETFLLVLDITVEIISRIINLYQQECGQKTFRENCTKNQSFWSGWLNFCFDLLEYNSAVVDEILIRFFRLYSRLQPEGKDRSDGEGKILLSPISSTVNDSVPLKLMLVIGSKKLEPLPESEFEFSLNIDSYEAYLRVFHENRSQFSAILATFCRGCYSNFATQFMFMLLQDMLGAPEDETRRTSVTGVNSWKSVTHLLCNMIPKLTFDAQQTSIMEIYFSRLLGIIKDPVQDLETLSFVLSCMSSMSNLYESFRIELIQQFVDGIFYLITKFSDGDPNDVNVMDMQHHAGALFIKLAKTRHSLLVPYFPMMVSFIDNLIQKKQITLMTSCFLYEGLFILSNHLSQEDQESFICGHFLPQISWIISYDMGPDGENFFRDIGLSTEPNCTENKFPEGHSILARVTAVVNLLSRLYSRFERNDPERCFKIFWPTFIQYLTPFYSIVANIHQIWAYRETGNQTRLDQLCHPFYQPYFFEEIPFYYLTQICVYQKHLIPPDRYKILMKEWKHGSMPPSGELIARHMQHRFWVLYSQSVSYLSTAIGYLIFFYTTQPTLEHIIENYIASQNSIICTNMRFMPIFVHHDLIRCYFQCLAVYGPRSEGFLSRSGTGETLTQLLEFIFGKLEESLMAIQQQNYEYDPKRRSLSGTKSITDNNNEKNCLEICIETIVKNVCGDFISLLLNGIFSPGKSVVNIIINNNNDDDGHMDLEDDMNDGDANGELDHSNLNNQQNPKQTGESGRQDDTETQCINDENEKLLSWFMMKKNPKPLTMVVIGCLQWPIGNLRRQICLVNQTLFRLLLSMNLINTIDAFYDLAGRVLKAISQTERSDIETLNLLIILLYMIYRDFIIKNNNKNITDAINEQLSRVCGTPLVQWKKFSQSIKQQQLDIKKAIKILRPLVEDVTDKGLPSGHSPNSTVISSLGTTDTGDDQNKKIIDLGDTFLSWL